MAQICGKSIKTIEKQSATYDWLTRTAAWELALLERIMDESGQAAIDEMQTTARRVSLFSDLGAAAIMDRFTFDDEGRITGVAKSVSVRDALELLDRGALIQGRAFGGFDPADQLKWMRHGLGSFQFEVLRALSALIWQIDLRPGETEVEFEERKRRSKERFVERVQVAFDKVLNKLAGELPVPGAASAR